MLCSRIASRYKRLNRFGISWIRRQLLYACYLSLNFQIGNLNMKISKDWANTLCKDTIKSNRLLKAHLVISLNPDLQSAPPTP